MRKRIDLTGRRLGRLAVCVYTGRKYWFCICDCGTRVVVQGGSLRGGRTKSCGCLRKDRSTKHGMSGTPEYSSWKAMMARCYNPCHVAYENYGGRGISVCDEWHSVEAFFADMGERPPGCSLDRIDPNEIYRPGNCRWSDTKQQNQNRRPWRRRMRTAVKRRKVKPLPPPPLDDPPF
jgi:hypothetical protein